MDDFKKKKLTCCGSFDLLNYNSFKKENPTSALK